jgi:20S proteasome alpha/beta subunit
MTYILGSRCKDGVVLVADTRFTVDNGTRYEYQDKLIEYKEEILPVVVGFSGNREPFTEFQMRFGESSETERVPMKTDKINLKISRIMRSLEGPYGRSYTYDIITGISAKPSILTYFYQGGQPERIERYKAIGNWQYGAIFLERNWHKDRTWKLLQELDIL